MSPHRHEAAAERGSDERVAVLLLLYQQPGLSTAQLEAHFKAWGQLTVRAALRGLEADEMIVGKRVNGDDVWRTAASSLYDGSPRAGSLQ